MIKLNVNEVEISSFVESEENFVQIYTHNTHIFAVNTGGSIYAYNSEVMDSNM